MKTTLHQVAPSLLKPHPRNSSIYGDEDISELVELIRDSQWVRPLVVTPNYTINTVQAMEGSLLVGMGNRAS